MKAHTSEEVKIKIAHATGVTPAFGDYSQAEEVQVCIAPGVDTR